MSWLLASPIWIVIIGVAAVGILGSAWVKTGRRPLLYALGVAILLTVVMLGIERLVETDEEAVDTRLHRMARDVQANDVNAVIGHLHSKVAPSTVSQIKSELPPQKFRVVDIKKNLKVEFFYDRSPPQAEATFNVELQGDFKYQGHEFPGGRVLIAVSVIFYQEKDGDWKVAAYSWAPVDNPFVRQR